MVCFDPIGKVVIEGGRYFLELDREVFAAARGLEDFSHIQMVWWFHLYDSAEARKCLVLDRPYAKGPGKIGVLATRGPVRPNPIAVTTCALIGVDPLDHRLEVSYTDAENGTPILDIKPYHPSEDRVRDVKMPAWCAHWPQYWEDSGDFDWGAEFAFHA